MAPQNGSACLRASYVLLGLLLFPHTILLTSALPSSSWSQSAEDLEDFAGRYDALGKDNHKADPLGYHGGMEDARGQGNGMGNNGKDIVGMLESRLKNLEEARTRLQMTPGLLNSRLFSNKFLDTTKHQNSAYRYDYINRLLAMDKFRPSSAAMSRWALQNMKGAELIKRGAAENVNFYGKNFQPTNAVQDYSDKFSPEGWNAVPVVGSKSGVHSAWTGDFGSKAYPEISEDIEEKRSQPGSKKDSGSGGKICIWKICPPNPWR